MKKLIISILSLSFVVLFITGCGAKAVDEKLDEEYNILRIDVQSVVTDVDSLMGRIHIAIDAHNHQDERINKYGPPVGEDKKMQDAHVQWIAEKEPVIAEIDNWLVAVNSTFDSHDSVEAAHETSNTKKIKAEHLQMAEELDAVKPKAEEYLVKIQEMRSDMEQFFTDHAYLNKKYSVPSEHQVRPPTYK